MLSTLRVRDVMTEALLLLRAETAIDEAWRQLHDAGVTGAPVLNAKGRLVGVLSNHDLADPRRCFPEGPGTVGDIMTRLIYAVGAEDSELMAERLMINEISLRADFNSDRLRASDEFAARIDRARSARHVGEGYGIDLAASQRDHATEAPLGAKLSGVGAQARREQPV
jgi:CBS domain